MHHRLRQHLRQCALAQLARREHSRRELHAKLRRSADKWLRAHSAAPAEIAAEPLIALLIDEFDRRGLQSDVRSAEVLVNAKSARWGQRRLQAELQRRGIGADVAAQALLPVAGNELARATALWQRRFGAVPTTAQEHARQIRFLAARGFTMDTVGRVLRAAGSAADDEPDSA